MLIKNYTILWQGNIIVKCIDEKSDYSQLILTHKNLIENTWKKQLILRGSNIFNGKIFNFSEFELQEGSSIIIKGFFVKYSEFITQRAYDSLNLRICPIGVSAISFLKRGNKKHFVFGKRSSSITQYPGF